MQLIYERTNSNAFQLEAHIIRLTDEQISEFQRLYKKHYGVDISRDEATEKGVKLIKLIKWVYTPDKGHPTLIDENISPA